MRRQTGIQLVEHNPWLDPRPSLFNIDLQDVLHVARKVQMYARTDSLARQARTSAARQNGETRIAGSAHAVDDIICPFRRDDAGSFHLVDAGIIRIEDTSDVVVAKLAFDSLTQLCRNDGGNR